MGQGTAAGYAVEAVTVAGLVDTLSDPELEVTVFAPSRPNKHNRCQDSPMQYWQKRLLPLAALCLFNRTPSNQKKWLYAKPACWPQFLCHILFNSHNIIFTIYFLLSNVYQYLKLVKRDCLALKTQYCQIVVFVVFIFFANKKILYRHFLQQDKSFKKNSLIIVIIFHLSHLVYLNIILFYLLQQYFMQFYVCEIVIIANYFSLCILKNITF
eukprot:TRINITY_DN7171_c2_g1_i7.p1 TRINITY_DN7171_c2_g1~~TRINITY_DN7171_c2_g1_i7.p1  ORF type:complete len:212 (+),score=-2.92 TRINITY_DN7171_c2_g1_i7:1-636(+)